MCKETDILSEHDQDEQNEKAEIRSYFRNRRNGVCVEVGSNEPISICSQSWHLEDKLDWQCILIEPNSALAAKTGKIRPQAALYECACTASRDTGSLEFHIPLSPRGEELTGHASLQKNADEHNYDRYKTIEVQTRTLTSILEEEGVEEVDLVSVDVEGTELEVLRGLDIDRYRPKLILLEDKHLYLRNHLYLKGKGYALVRRLNRNCWYIPQNDAHPRVGLKEKIQLLKRLYFSIWFNKLQYALRHKTLQPFQSL